MSIRNISEKEKLPWNDVVMHYDNDEEWETTIGEERSTSELILSVVSNNVSCQFAFLSFSSYSPPDEIKKKC
jgi:hypothetical protein